jgi:hypothetical protein
MLKGLQHIENEEKRMSDTNRLTKPRRLELPVRIFLRAQELAGRYRSLDTQQRICSDAGRYRSIATQQRIGGQEAMKLLAEMADLMDSRGYPIEQLERLSGLIDDIGDGSDQDELMDSPPKSQLVN